MITFERNKNIVKTCISTSTGWEFNFNHTCSDEPYAIFLITDIQSKFNKRIEQIRREAYEEGWADHRRKRVKKYWFSGLITRNIHGREY